MVRGIIRKIYDNPAESWANWWVHPYLITLYTKSPTVVFYMFFPSKTKLEQHRFVEGENVIVKGFLRFKWVRSHKKHCLTAIERGLESDFVNYG